MIPSDQTIRSLFDEMQARHPRVMRALAGEPAGGYPLWMLNIMEHAHLERIAGKPGYRNDPVGVYRAAQERIGVDFIDQWIPDNPLSMGDHGYEHAAPTATTGSAEVVLDGWPIQEPEDVLEHLEQVVFPDLAAHIRSFDEEARIREIGLGEYEQQREMGEGMLKTGYEYVHFPTLRYFTYGYVNYFCAYAMAPEVMARDFQLQAQLNRLNNQAAARAVERYHLPKLFRLDHDMTDSSSTLVNIRSLEKIWFPRLFEALEPMLNTGSTLIWHCDGAITPMIDPLLEVGIRGFQGFQYEDGVDYPALCQKKTRDGQPLFIIGGASVTRTLPFGRPEDVARELKWLVEQHGPARLALGCSSSMAPGVKWENVQALLEGLAYYQNHR